MSNFLPAIKKGSLVLLPIIGLTFFNLYLSTWSVRHNDLNLHADVARDFLLLEELDEKKLVFIGARTSTTGIFHGPLWSYLNYPAYLLGNGDPIIVGWYWVLLAILFVGSSFAIANQLFNPKVAAIYALLLSGNMIFHTNALSHSHGALFLIPTYIYTMLLYKRLKRWWLLASHFIIGGLIIQFQMAVGIPFVLISALLSLYLIKKHKQKTHLLAFFAIPLTLINFILFEIKHGFNMTKAIIGYASPKTGSAIFNYTSLLLERVNKAMELQLTPGLSNYMSGFIFAAVIYLTYKQWKRKRGNRDLFILFPVYYFGYLLFTLLNKGIVMIQQFFPTLALTNLWFAAAISTSRKKLTWLLVAVVVVLNLHQANSYLSDLEKNFSGKAPGSWKFLNQLGREIASKQKGEFGYFLYSPDIFAYTPRYAMRYIFKDTGAQAYEFEKKSVTYVIAGPPAKDRPGLSYDWWRENKVNIKAEPTEVIKKPNGYLIERFELTPEQQKQPWEHLINVGIHFR